MSSGSTSVSEPDEASEADSDNNSNSSDSDSEHKKQPAAAAAVSGDALDQVGLGVGADGERVVDQILLSRSTHHNGAEVVEYFVKWKNMSYLHCAWLREDVMLREDKFAKVKIKRFFRMLFHDEKEPFNPAYLVIDRILGEKTTQGKKQVLIKWKGLSYADISWEDWSAVEDADAWARYISVNTIPPASERGPPPPRPARSSWQKLDAPVFKNGNTLRDYQLEGFNWLVFCWYERRNSMLADEMGLGKTIQTVATLDYLFRYQKIRGPFLIVAPLSTIAQWQREVETWTEMNAVVYHGSAEARRIIRDYEFFYREKERPLLGCYKFHIMITTYEMISTDTAELRKIPWRYLVVDEGHRLKNVESRLQEDLATFSADHKLLLTGTPLQNNTGELWSLLHFLDAEKFNSCSEFLAQFGDLKSKDQVDALQLLLRPYMLRRMKENVEKSLVAKEETIVNVELTAIQKTYYRAIYDRNRAFLVKTKGATAPSLMNIMMELRKLCNHPFLINGVEENLLAAKKPDEHVVDTLIRASGKLVLIDKLLPKLRQDGHQVLIFSQMVRVLDILEDYLNYRKYPYERFDGRIRGPERQAAIDRFCRPGSDRFVFLISTKAGGLGINLTAADTVIIYDSDWNPQNDLQAQARCHRIGQTKPVKVYRLVTTNTYESFMFERASMKLGLDRAVLSKMSAMEEGGELGKQEIDTLLKYGAYHLMDDDNEAATKFCEADIDTILSRSKVVVQESGATTAEDNALSSFSKASFVPVAEEGEKHIDLNDPHFWQKILPQQKEQDPLLQFQPRQRKQVQRWGINDLGSDSDTNGKDGGNADDDSDADSLARLSSLFPPWERSHIRDLRRAINNFGYGQWTLLQGFCDSLKEKSLKDIKHHADATIRHLFRSLESKSHMTYIHVIRAVRALDTFDPRSDVIVPPHRKPWSYYDNMLPQEPHIPFEPPKDFPRSSGSNAAEPNSTHGKLETIRRELRKINSLTLLFRLQEENALEVPTLDASVPAPTTWWEKRDDLALLQGVLLHGAGRTGAIMADPAFGFRQRIEAELRELDSSRVSAAPLEAPVKMEDDPPAPAVANEVSAPTVDSSGAPTSTAVKMEDDAADAEEDAVVATGAGTGADGDEEDDGAQSASLSALLAGRPLPLWATDTEISKRLTNLLNAITKTVKMRETIERNKRKDAERRSGVILPRVKETPSSEWTRKEKNTFFTTLSMFGLQLDLSGNYRWDLFQSKAHLGRKSDDMLQLYLDEVIALCQRTFQEHQAAKAHHAKLNAAGKTTGPMALVVVDDDLKLTPVRATRFTTRLQLLHDLSTAIRDPVVVDTKIRGAKHPGPHVCEWWYPKTHDRALMYAVDRHGWGNWGTICGDPDFPFHAVMAACLQVPSGAQATQGGRSGAATAEADAEDFQAEEGGDDDTRPAATAAAPAGANALLPFPEFPAERLLWRRLEHLCKLILGEQKSTGAGGLLPMSSMADAKRPTARAPALPVEPESAPPPSKSKHTINSVLGKRKAEDDDDFQIAAKRAPPRDKDQPKEKPKQANPSGPVATPQPQMPMDFGTHVIESLGKIMPGRRYHSAKFIFPLGYTSRVQFASLADPTRQCAYICDITEDKAKTKPIFRVRCTDNDHIETGDSPVQPWANIMIKLKSKDNNWNALELWGFTDPRVQEAIEGLPQAAAICTSYHKFEKQKPQLPGQRTLLGEPTKPAGTAPLVKK
eukprot:TRINITY_DN6646_c0_g1_i1.p1 TRINITY_DN6646_c0_g1~~TRINITY_DN6646_c0_g1_i1.p1  ORF type:complete len:1934 (+),score=399.24 TRINITY_DN6646_c0_g1_i1:667-5802(+)